MGLRETALPSAFFRKVQFRFLSSTNQFFTGKSWLEHTKCCGIIDYELLKGATIIELVKRSGRNLNGVIAHINHLKTEHGLSISNIEGVFKIEFSHPK